MMFSDQSLCPKCNTNSFYVESKHMHCVKHDLFYKMYNVIKRRCSECSHTKGDIKYVRNAESNCFEKIESLI